MELSEDSGSDYMPPHSSDRSHVSDSENSEGENDYTEGNNLPVTKKRLRNEHLWEKNVRKTKKVRGERYTSATGKIFNAKTFVPIICKCFKKCHNFISDE